MGTKPGRFLGEPAGQYLATIAALVGDEALDVPWSALPAATQQTALHGAGAQVVSVTWRYQRGQRSGTHTFEGTWDGLCGRVEHEARLRARRKDAEEWSSLLVDRPCADCGGARLNAQARSVSLGGLTLPALLDRPLDTIADVFANAPLSPLQHTVLDAIWPDVRAGVTALSSLGLGHLTLARRSGTLSDGELQRVRLAAVAQSGLTGVTVVLDEPSAGLHTRDMASLAGILRGLRDAGNTVVVVDHRPDLLRSADHLIELGPGAGSAGGRIVAQGSPEAVLAGADHRRRFAQPSGAWNACRSPRRSRCRGPRCTTFSRLMYSSQHAGLSPLWARPAAARPAWCLGCWGHRLD